MLYHHTSNAIYFDYGSIGNDYVFIDRGIETMNSLNSKMNKFYEALNNSYDENFPCECIDLIFGLMCHISFPLCDYNSDNPAPRRVCILCYYSY